MEGRVNIIQHLNKDIIYADYSGLTGKEFEKVIDQYYSTVKNLIAQGKSDLLIILNVKGVSLNMELWKKSQRIRKDLAPYVKGLAVIGVTGLKKYFMDVTDRMTKLNQKVFNSFEEAKRWLVKL